MIQPPVPARDDVIVFELLRTARGARDPETIGSARFTAGRIEIEAPENVKASLEDELERPFVDRIQADERPAGYRRSNRAGVDFLVPGMPEHFRARLRGLWLSYPDGSVVTARAAEYQPPARRVAARRAAPEQPVTETALRSETLVENTRALGRPLVRAHPPAAGVRPEEVVPVGRSDCGWIH